MDKASESDKSSQTAAAILDRQRALERPGPLLRRGETLQPGDIVYFSLTPIWFLNSNYDQNASYLSAVVIEDRGKTVLVERFRRRGSPGHPILVWPKHGLRFSRAFVVNRVV